MVVVAVLSLCVVNEHWKWNDDEKKKPEKNEWAKNCRWGFWTFANKCLLEFGCRCRLLKRDKHDLCSASSCLSQVKMLCSATFLSLRIFHKIEKLFNTDSNTMGIPNRHHRLYEQKQNKHSLCVLIGSQKKCYYTTRWRLITMEFRCRYIWIDFRQKSIGKVNSQVRQNLVYFDCCVCLSDIRTMIKSNNKKPRSNVSNFLENKYFFCR